MAIVNTTKRDTGLSGFRVLIVEDDFLLASYIAKLLENEGCRIVGLARSVDKALALVDNSMPEAAILDANLAGASTAPVAEALRARGVPFLLVTGYGENDLGAEVLRQAPRLEKPVQAEAMIRTLSALTRWAPRPPQPAPRQPTR